jgi:manganese transport protein
VLNILADREPRPSLPDSFRTVGVGGGWLKKALSFAGPGYMVSVGYMDPGNWATDLEGGSKFAYRLLWVILASNLMAMLLQSLCVRLGVIAERDLAQACRDFYKKPVVIALWLLCEIAIIACDVAEVIGSAIGLQLLFGIPLVVGVLITGLDVLLLLGLTRFGFRKLEAVVITLVATIFVCFAIDIWLAKPDWNAAATGLLHPTALKGEELAIAVGILGATVMPHNLYLHSSIVQTRNYDRSPEGKRQASRMATVDVIIALGAAFFVNAAILVLAAAVFNKTGSVVKELQDAHLLLKPALGGAAATLFAVALLASGQSSTITGTLAGQIVMEGFLNIRVKPWVRRLITRCLALIPAVLLVTAAGNNNVQVLVYSQIVLSMQLPFAIIPLAMFTSDKKRMNGEANPIWLQVAAYAVCAIITLLNLRLVFDQFGPIWFGACIGVVALFGLWVMFFYRGRSDNI